jgi:multidrug resistance efflux pump
MRQLRRFLFFWRRYGVRAARNITQTALEKRTLTSPIAGTMVDLTLDAGELIAVAVPVVIVANLSGWRIETTDLNELKVVNLAPGLPVRVRLGVANQDVRQAQLDLLLAYPTPEKIE